jgi:hypothetical protein
VCTRRAHGVVTVRSSCAQRRGGVLTSGSAAGQRQGATGELAGATWRASGKAVGGWSSPERRRGVEEVEDASGGGIRRWGGSSGRR